MFEAFSERSRRIVFLSRKTAGRRGASAIGVEDLIDALVVEDQGDFLKAASENAPLGAAVPVMPKYQPFFTAETTAEIRRGLEPLMLPEGERLPDSVDMPISDAMKHLLESAKELSEEMRHEPLSPSHIHTGHVEPLHLMAAALGDSTSAAADIAKRAGVTREAVIAAIKRGDSL